MARGDHLMVWRGRSGEDGLVGFWHSGIDVGDGTVIHYAGTWPGVWGGEGLGVQGVGGLWREGGPRGAAGRGWRTAGGGAREG